MHELNRTPLNGSGELVKGTDFLRNGQSISTPDGTAKVTASMIRQEQAEFSTPTPHSNLLSKLLEAAEAIKQADFKKLADLDEDVKLKRNHVLVTVIEQVLDLAKKNNWGLCRQHDLIYLYNGTYWSLLDEDELTDFLGKAAEKMGIDKFDARYYPFQEQLYKQFIRAAHLPKPTRPKHVTLINLANGTFEVTSERARLRAFKRNDFLTYQLPFAYQAQATAPIFQEYLNRVLPDLQLQQILAEYVGYLFVRDLKLEKCLLPYGSGANGKSVFFDIVNALLGPENVCNLSLKNLAEENNRALLANKLLNYGSEIRSGIESDIFKQLASNEPIQARFLYRDSFIMTDYARLCFNCNELPRDVEHNEAYFRRFLIIPFEQTIPEEERDPELARKIISNELAGVFNWVLEGLYRLLKQKKFTDSVAVRNAVKSYRLESDSVALYLQEENYEPSTTESESLGTQYVSYTMFCRNDGYKSVSKRKFSERLKTLGYMVDRKNYGVIVYLQKNWSTN